MNYHTLTIALCCACCTSGIDGLTIVNHSDSPKHLELTAYIPNTKPLGGFTPRIILTKDLQPQEMVETPLSLHEVGIAISWGNEILFQPESATDQNPVKRAQFTLFRHFSPQDASPAPYVRGIPKYIGQDHMFEITGSSYDADIMLVYRPQQSKTNPSGTRKN